MVLLGGCAGGMFASDGSDVSAVASAGARHRSNRQELIELIRGAGRIPAQRDTLYNHLVVHRDPADDPVDDRVHSHVSSTAFAQLPVVAAG